MGSKLGKEYGKAYCHLAYLIYMHKERAEVVLLTFAMSVDSPGSFAMWRTRFARLVEDQRS